MSFADDTIDVIPALGKGVYSVSQDIVLGVEKTGEGLGSDGRVWQQLATKIGLWFQ